MKHTQRPLAGYRVIDFGQYLAGPLVAMTLADQGAEVIRVDPPEGPMWDTPANAMLNRGKRSIALDLKDPADVEIAQRLIASADVVIENFRPGVMERLGLGAEAMTALNPRLTYLSLPGFSKNDPERRGWQAWEGVVAAATGMFTDMGLNRVLMGLNPSYTPLPLASAYAAVLGGLAVTMALYARERDGCGEVIEVPLASALMEGLVHNSIAVENLPERYMSLREREMQRRHESGEPMDMSYEQIQDYLDPFYKHYRCADGRKFYAVCSSHRWHPIKCLQVLGLWEEFEAAGVPLDDPYQPASAFPDGVVSSLRTYPIVPPWNERLSRRMAEVFATKTSFEWERLFGEHGVPGCAHRTTKEWLNDEHALASGLVLQVDDPRHGHMHQAGNLAWLEGDAAAMNKRPAPELDADREAILTELPPLPEPSSLNDAPREPALAGLKILDLTNVIAGPTIASTLARFGAEVISLDPVEPMLDPWNAIIFGLQANRGKRSLLLDIKSDEGREILNQLLAEVDVVTFNGLDRQLEPLGISPAQLKAINPNIILCRFDSYGGPATGPRSEHPGYDDLAQATTGIMARFGGALETPEEHAHLGTIDVMGGFCGALAIGIALLQQQNGGGTDIARASLTAAGQVLQAPFMYDFNGRPPFDEPSGRHAKGEHALYRLYRANDGWFFLGARWEDRTTLAGIDGLEGIDAVPDETLENWLVERFANRPADQWIAALRALDIGAHRTDTMAAVRAANLQSADNPALELHGNSLLFLRHAPHPSGRSIDLIAPMAIRFEGLPISVPEDQPQYGAQSRSELVRLGYSNTQIDELLAHGVIAERWGDGSYLPD